MEEIVVWKQGSFRSGNWTQRILSLHADLGLAAITAKDSQEDKFNESVRVGNVQIWPQYLAKHIKEDFQSAEAKLTVRVKGLPAKIGFREMDTPAGPQRVYRFTRPGPGAEHLTWMLRFRSFDDLEKAVRLFQAMKVGDAPLSSQRASATDTADAIAPQGDLGGEGEEVKQEVDATAVATIIAGDVDEELRAIRGQNEQNPQQHTNYTTL